MVLGVRMAIASGKEIITGRGNREGLLDDVAQLSFLCENSLDCTLIICVPFSMLQFNTDFSRKGEEIIDSDVITLFHIVVLLIIHQDLWKSCLTFLCLKLPICKRKIIELPSS